MPIKTIVLIGFGFFFLALGGIGLLIPILPTTPFVLISAACFSCSPHLKAKIMRIGFFREHIENYTNKTGLSQKTVAMSLVWLWGMLLLSILVLQVTWVSILLFSTGFIVTAHILWIAKAERKKKV